MWLATGSATRELRDGEIVVGSGADADWRIQSADLMPRHFVLVVHGLNASLRPTSPDSIVVVNARQVDSPYLLDDGDEILAGSGRFIFSENEPRAVAPYTPPTERAYLIDESTKAAYELVSRSTTVGRDPSNAILVRDPTSSRFHAEVRREAGGYALHSMGSAGTTVNDKSVTSPVLLGDNDIIEVAFTRLRFARDAAGMTPAGRAGPEDRERLWSQKNPTLDTAKISIVQAAGSHPSRRGWLIAIIAIAVVLMAAILLTRSR
ncbi:MAG TPA: FHA domain-containing protein [Gemmatimonadaceae bacterium]|jgi:pSer/pThr/pTyr-binding forkhead associated (FHA) protein|nr:FHA domain-containing protein [Gemmatimonadaceae bacterium]